MLNKYEENFSAKGLLLVDDKENFFFLGREMILARYNILFSWI